MILVLLINHYESHLGLAGVFDRGRKPSDRLRPLFDYLEVTMLSRSLCLRPLILGMSKAHLIACFNK